MHKKAYIKKFVLALSLALVFFAACSKKNNKNPRVGAAQGLPGAPVDPKAQDLIPTKPENLVTPPGILADPNLSRPTTPVERGEIEIEDQDLDIKEARPTLEETKELDKTIRETKMVEPTEGYTLAKLKSEENSSIYAIALLDKEEQSHAEIKLTCYDGTKSMEGASTPWMALLPKSQALVEVYNSGKDIDTLRSELEKKEELKEEQELEYLLSTCEGRSDLEKIQTSSFVQRKDFNVVRMRDGDYETAYFGNKREAVNISISCRSEFKTKSEMGEEKDDDRSDIVVNRITLNKNSRIFFAQPLDYFLKKDDRTLKESKPELRKYTLYICN